MQVGINKTLLQEDDKLARKEYTRLLQTRDLYNQCCSEEAEQMISNGLLNEQQRDLWQRMLHFVKTPLFKQQEEYLESLHANKHD